MRTIPVLQIGLGGVGRALVDQVLRYNERLGGRYGVRFRYVALADRQGALVDDERIPPALLLDALRIKRDGGALLDLPQAGPLNAWPNLLTPAPCLIVDVTAQDQAEDDLVAAVAQGHRVVLANKKPLCGSAASFRALTEGGHTRYEATVGAGLPIIATLRMLLDTGDQIDQIAGCFSGTLGFLATQLAADVPYSAAVREAKARGWTEPDPRDDLGGTDVARKALILARTCGIGRELADVEVESLFPSDLADLAVPEFMERIDQLDQTYRNRTSAAAADGNTLRYVAEVSSQRLKVGLIEVDQASEIGSLRGPDNLVVFRTQRYREQPLIVRGPGAGVDVTASAVLNDMLAFGREGDGG